MKYMILAASLLSLAPLNHANQPVTYEQIEKQLQQEADRKEAQVRARFTEAYPPAIAKQFIGAAAFGTFLSLAIIAIKNNHTVPACFYAALSAFFGSWALLSHAELMSFRELCDKEISNADQVYQNKMSHIHKRHYLNDIAKFQVASLEQLLGQFIVPAPTDIVSTDESTIDAL